jgi:hypothetical protein
MHAPCARRARCGTRSGTCSTTPRSTGVMSRAWIRTRRAARSMGGRASRLSTGFAADLCPCCRRGLGSWSTAGATMGSSTRPRFRVAPRVFGARLPQDRPCSTWQHCVAPRGTLDRERRLDRASRTDGPEATYSSIERAVPTAHRRTDRLATARMVPRTGHGSTRCSWTRSRPAADALLLPGADHAITHLQVIIPATKSR